MKFTRRQFLEDAALVLAASAIPGKVFAEEAVKASASPNEKIRLAVVGVSGRGRSHINSYTGMDDVEIVALCDVDTAAAEGQSKVIVDKGRPAPKLFTDMRRLLDDKSIDCVSIATPNHWHALQAIWAMQAGKDVYLEKPVSHNIWEGRKIIEAARKYNRVCQAGTQSRSNPGMIDGIKYIHDGKIGKVSLARGLCYKRRNSIGNIRTPVEPPPTVNYDLWLGPAPKKPVMRQRFHYDWHWFWDYGDGDLGNQGVHEMDKARWGLGRKELPKSAMTYGGRFGYWDNGETPNTVITHYDYDDAQLVFEVRGLPTEGMLGAGIGNIWYGTEGYVVAPSYSRTIVYNNDGEKIEEFSGGGDHFRNFFDAVRSRNIDSLHCDIEEGHLSSALCHLSKVSYKLGERLPLTQWQKDVDNDQLAEALDRAKAHLADNAIGFDHWSFVKGRRLHFDPQNEVFVGDEEADEYIARKYRKPYVVPERV